MKHGIAFAACGFFLVYLAAKYWPWGALYLWPAFAFLVVSAAYLALGPAVFGKQADGRLAWWSYLLLGPFLLIYWFLWKLLATFSREPCSHEVSPGLWLSRRPVPGELPEVVRLVVDLTCEFAGEAVGGREYLSFPILDANVPDPAPFLSLVERLTACADPILIHCAQGHGRTGILAIALFIRRGLAADIPSALALIRRTRPGVALNRTQLRFLENIAAALPPR